MSNLCDYKDCLEPAEVNGLCRLHYGQDMDERQADKDRIEVLQHEVDMWRKHVPELEAENKSFRKSYQDVWERAETAEATIKRMEQSYLEGVTYEYYKAGEAK